MLSKIQTSRQHSQELTVVTPSGGTRHRTPGSEFEEQHIREDWEPSSEDIQAYLMMRVEDGSL